MNGITVIIPTKDDDDVIADAIRSTHGFADEVIVVDANQDNKTALVANKLGAKVIKHIFKNFSDQRNFGMDHALTPWVLYLDSDERLTDEFKKEVMQKVEFYNEDSNIAGFFIHRKTYFYGQDWNFTDKVQRLFYRKKFVEWSGTVHETPKVKGDFSEIKSPILHFTHRNLSQMVRKTNEWSEFEARLRLNSSHPPLVAWRFFRVMATAFIDSYIKNKGYKNGTYGLIEGIYQAFSIFITYAKLWELQNVSKKD